MTNKEFNSRLTGPFDENFLERCLTCQHIACRKSDIDEYYCRKRNGKCEYKEYKKKDKKK